jgi:hypothetical protein
VSFILSRISFSVLNTHYVDYGMRSYLEEAGEIEGELKERNEEKDE